MLLRGYTFIGLNVIRALSIIAMLLVFSSTIFVMVTNIKAVNYYEAHKGDNNATMAAMNMDYISGSTVPNQPAGIFWAILASLLIMFQTVILILSECSLPFFDRFLQVYFPVLGSGFGTGALGIFQCLIGAQILSHHVDEFTLVAAFFLFSLGCVNMFLGLIFRESGKSKRSITSWRAESKAILPTIHDPRPVFVNASPAFTHHDSYTGPGYNEKAKVASEFGSIRSTDKAGYGFGRQGEKVAGLRGFILQRPEESLPRYASPSPPHSPPTVPVALSRNQSTTSSFASPEPQMQESTSDYDEEEDEIYEEEEDEESIQHHHAPVFKSSRTAL